MASMLSAQISPALSQKADNAAEITDIAERAGHVSVIVEFASPMPPDQIKPDPAVLASLKAQIAAIQDSIIETHFGSAANPRPGQGFDRSLRRFDITPMFAVSVNRSELDALAADPRGRAHPREQARPYHAGQLTIAPV